MNRDHMMGYMPPLDDIGRAVREAILLTPVAGPTTREDRKRRGREPRIDWAARHEAALKAEAFETGDHQPDGTVLPPARVRSMFNVEGSKTGRIMSNPYTPDDRRAVPDPYDTRKEPAPGAVQGGSPWSEEAIKRALEGNELLKESSMEAYARLYLNGQPSSHFVADPGHSHQIVQHKDAAIYSRLAEAQLRMDEMRRREMCLLQRSFVRC